MNSFDILDALVFPDDPLTPTSPSFSYPSSSDLASTTASSSAAHDPDYAAYSSQHDPWAAFPQDDYPDYNAGLYGTGMMGLDLGGSMVGPSGSAAGGGGIELMDIGQSRPL